ncbi:hypothetical protein A3K34_03545 [candidate division WWE3 bacterium RIFOXYC1_FULL_40_10]|nr:MAG: hypothetical protein A3K58_03545 [candidate division WWE3 bacterium RIFOXYB1_FULL_40_22]OGC61920.1 MAG: hypothetical protein A3K37_03545 [candidate division WWE3 bacterium RIFOXYA1_FULL_40_11]OGC66303.1 MAG: hypothetical protein A3K34_03545 [candidate division WWE3 bacterium RIFOXYC1_FULL_40_10]OGC67906.1 MAG: hypothetical protein A2450_01735 [candidate division WWE3 bacterium RIFOXYC2_FULL_40_11]OGC70569.1 MAG: hypothetical protein A2602_02730 [candidate division WWE3 bacterium RIFOXYD
MNLTKTSAAFKKGLKVAGIIVLVYYITTLYIYPFAKSIYRRIIVKVDPPNALFGQLDQLEFTSKPIKAENVTYVLNTKNGRLPEDMPFKMKVYKFEQGSVSFTAGGEALDTAAFMGFSDSDLISDLKGSTYKWRSLSSGGLLEINKDTRTIELSTDLTGPGQEYFRGYFAPEAAQESARALFKSIKRFDSLYESGKQEVVMGKFNGSTIANVDKGSGQIARVDFFRFVKEGNLTYMILGPDPSKGLLHTYVRKVSKEPSPFNYPIVQGYFKEVNTDSKAFYPVIEVASAWKAVKQGSGIIAQVSPKANNPFEEYEPVAINTILINNIKLAYYESPQNLRYLQPIFVFEGNYRVTGGQGGDIVIYFPAVSGEYVKKN